MSREFGKFYMTAWSDRDFIALSVEAQRLYMFLVSQHDLSRAGVITMALRRWSRSAAGLTPDSVLGALSELAAARFVVVDEGEEEVLVRSFIRTDEGWKSPNIMKSIRGAAQGVISETLRAVIREELLRIDTSVLSVTVNDRTGRSTREVVEFLIRDTAEALSGCVSDPEVASWGYSKGSGNPSGKGSGKGSPPEGLLEGFGEGSLTTTTTATTTATSTATTTSGSPPPPDEDPDFAAFYALYPRKDNKREAAKAYSSARKRASVSVILDGVREFANDPNLPDRSKERAVIPLPATWLNGNRWENGPLPPRHFSTPRQSERDERLNGLARLHAQQVKEDSS